MRNNQRKQIIRSKLSRAELNEPFKSHNNNHPLKRPTIKKQIIRNKLSMAELNEPFGQKRKFRRIRSSL